MITLKNDYHGARALVGKFTKAIVDTIDPSSLIKLNIVNYPELIKMMIDTGLNPNGQGRKTPIAVVLGMQYLMMSKKIELLHLLVENGEECSHLCHVGKSSTTPLHVATELALQSGKVNI